MQKLIRNILFLGILFFSLIKTPAAVAMDNTFTINFDRIKPTESLCFNQPIPKAFSLEKIDGIQAEVTEPLTGANSRQTLSPGRLRLSLNGQSFQLTNSAITISGADQIKHTDPNSLTLELKVKPEDRADCYTGIVTLKTWVNQNGGREWKDTAIIKLNVEILPWIKMQCETKQIIIDQTDYSTANLTNRQPVQLRIASNSNWDLFCKLDSDFGILPTTVKIIFVRNNRLQVINSSATITVDRLRLALGDAVGNGDDYWLELLLEIEINDYTKHAVNEYAIPLQFTAQLRDGKSVIQ